VLKFYWWSFSEAGSGCLSFHSHKQWFAVSKILPPVLLAIWIDLLSFERRVRLCSLIRSLAIILQFLLKCMNFEVTSVINHRMWKRYVHTFTDSGKIIFLRVVVVFLIVLCVYILWCAFWFVVVLCDCKMLLCCLCGKIKMHATN